MRLTTILLFISYFITAQESYEKIKIKKSDYSIYFFNTSTTSYSINASSNVFYLRLGSSRKCKTLIEINNGQLKALSGDSLYKLAYLPGMNYRHYYINPTELNDNISPSDKNCSLFKTEVNGANTAMPDSVIQIKLLNLNGDTIHLVNKYYYR